MYKKIACCLILFFSMFGCGNIETEEDEYAVNNTDYYYETGNQFIFDGHQKIKAGDYLGAVKDFTRAMDELPGYAYLYGFRAWAKQKSKNYEGALADINKAIEMQSDIADFYKWRAEIYRDIGEDDLMKEDFKKERELKKYKQQY